MKGDETAKDSQPKRVFNLWFQLYPWEHSALKALAYTAEALRDSSLFSAYYHHHLHAYPLHAYSARLRSFIKGPVHCDAMRRF